jgi:DNA-binding LytR/AlgR family response regulator
MDYRCVVVDDERPARERLKRLLSGHGGFEVVGEAADADAAVRLIDEVSPDLCFLDVQMPEGDGFDVLARVKKIPNVIFTTAFDQYAVRAFEVSSIDYLLKPFGKKRFAEALERARKALEQRESSSARLLDVLEQLRDGMRNREGEGVPAGESEPRRISAKRGSRILLLEPSEVFWFEAEETLVFACTAGGRFLVERTLAELEQELGSDFFRAHRGYLVNLARVAEIRPGEAGTYDIVFRDPKRSSVPLSRRQARKLRERFPW